MAILDQAARIINCKIVYYGPGMSGKTSSLQTLYQIMPADRRGDLLSIATETERTLFFDCTPPETPLVRGFTVRFHLYTVPGCVLYERAKIAVLQGADGIVFVADSQRDKLQEDIKSLQEMVRGLYANGRSLDNTPVVLQYNKRDLVPYILPAEVMDKYLNPLGWPRFESTLWWRDGDHQMRRTVGVFEAFREICARVIARLG
jgi:mutual gliding-motility protein MglA